MRSFLPLLAAILIFFGFSASSQAECTFTRNDAAGQGVTIKHDRQGDCIIKWKQWKSRPFSNSVHIYGIHDDHVYYIATDAAQNTPGRQEFFGWGNLLEPYDSIWFPPVIVEGKIFYAAANHRVPTTNPTHPDSDFFVVFGANVYRPFYMNGIGTNGPLVYNGEPVLTVRLPDGTWAITVGNTLDSKSFPPLTRWGNDEPTVFGAAVVNGELIYNSASETDPDDQRHVWGTTF